MGEEELFLCCCNALKDFITFSYFIIQKEEPLDSLSQANERKTPFSITFFVCVVVTSSNMKMVRANVSSWKYQTTLQTFDLKLELSQLQIVDTRQKQTTNTIFEVFYSIRLNNLFCAVNRKNSIYYIL